MPYFVKKLRVERWDVSICEADNAVEVAAQKDDNTKETYLGSNTGVADGEILVFGPFATMEEAEDDDRAQVETPAQFIAVC